MARPNTNALMTSAEIAQTFGDNTAVLLEARQEEIIRDLRLLRLDIVDIHDEDQAQIDACVEDFMNESRANADRIRDIRKARSESIGMNLR